VTGPPPPDPGPLVPVPTVRAVPGGCGRSVDVTVLVRELGVLEACLDGAVPAGRGNLGAAATA
jgi:hypothetical protein